jgi:hypothetical protein
MAATACLSLTYQPGPLAIIGTETERVGKERLIRGLPVPSDRSFHSQQRIHLDLGNQPEACERQMIRGNWMDFKPVHIGRALQCPVGGAVLYRPIVANVDNIDLARIVVMRVDQLNCKWE